MSGEDRKWVAQVVNIDIHATPRDHTHICWMFDDVRRVVFPLSLYLPSLCTIRTADCTTVLTPHTRTCYSHSHVPCVFACWLALCTYNKPCVSRSDEPNRNEKRIKGKEKKTHRPTTERFFFFFVLFPFSFSHWGADRHCV